MIRELRIDEIDAANRLLHDFNFSISIELFNRAFFKTLIYYDNGIKGIIVYDLLYDRIEIEYIVVDKKYRKNGIGRRLIKELENYDIQNITLEVKESNIEAINFYKNNNFKIVAIRKKYYGTEDGYLMLKELGE